MGNKCTHHLCSNKLTVFIFGLFIKNSWVHISSGRSSVGNGKQIRSLRILGHLKFPRVFNFETGMIAMSYDFLVDGAKTPKTLPLEWNATDSLHDGRYILKLNDCVVFVVILEVYSYSIIMENFCLIKQIWAFFIRATSSILSHQERYCWRKKSCTSW